MYKNYLFTVSDLTSEFYGETFFVYATNRSEATLDAHAYFPDVKLDFLGVYEDDEADMMGYDTY